MTYLLYSPEIEVIEEDEAEIFSKIADTFIHMGYAGEQKEGRARRVSHARATALLVGELIIEQGLPAELAQGIAAGPARFEAIVRFAQGSGERFDDKISTHRGMAIKLLRVAGAHIAESQETESQDFVLEAQGKAFINANAHRFLAHLCAGIPHPPSLSSSLKNVLPKVADATEAAREGVGLESKGRGLFRHSPLHPLAEAYFSQVAMRWGDYIAKIGLFPTDATLASLTRIKVDQDGDPDASRTAMSEHFAGAGAAFELRVQLARDIRTTPVEDASKEWPEYDNPYRAVGLLVLKPQISWSANQEEQSDHLSFQPANSLVAHRPLGQIMRARLFVYGKLASLRRSCAVARG